MMLKQITTNSSIKNILLMSLRPLNCLLHPLSSLSPCKNCARHLSLSNHRRQKQDNPKEWQTKVKGTNPEFNWEFLCNPSNESFIEENIVNRKGIGDLQKVKTLLNEYNKETEEKKRDILWRKLILTAADLPNMHHPSSPLGEESNARVVDIIGKPREFDFKVKTVVEIGEKLDILRTDNVTTATGPRTYYFKDDLADLEYALIQFTLNRLIQQGFKVISVPDLIYSPVIESCGFNTIGDRNQVYKLHSTYSDVCLAGTAEMSLAGFLANEELRVQDLPQKLTAVSRCYRREASDVQEEKGIYRVHQFTKIEMFGITKNETGEESDQLLQQFIQIEENLFSQLGLYFRILEMPTQCLGAPAYRKYDMEAWMPAKQFWGEISSASNCTDYQSRRLGIKYTNSNGHTTHTHTINGTACAIPRMIMAIVENYQREDGNVDIPDVLQSYMKNKTKIKSPQHKHNVQWMKSKKLKY